MPIREWLISCVGVRARHLLAVGPGTHQLHLGVSITVSKMVSRALWLAIRPELVGLGAKLRAQRDKLTEWKRIGLK